MDIELNSKTLIRIGDSTTVFFISVFVCYFPQQFNVLLIKASRVDFKKLSSLKLLKLHHATALIANAPALANRTLDTGAAAPHALTSSFTPSWSLSTFLYIFLIYHSYENVITLDWFGVNIRIWLVLCIRISFIFEELILRFFFVDWKNKMLVEMTD